MILSAGFTMSVVLAELLTSCQGKKVSVKRMFRFAAFFLIFLIFAVNAFHYTRLYQNRSFQISKVNGYLEDNTDPGDVVIGAWAPSFTWNSDNRSFPVWDGFLN
jgi:energy-coupling factor transporter transmembrane protein EcfT